ncbi:MAG: M64 family metallopeptidase, partial [Planctomycetota bacterium]
MNRILSIRPLAMLALLSTSLFAAGEEPSPDARQQRWKDRKAEEKVHIEKIDALDAERRARLAKMGIVGVETIGDRGDPAGCVDVVFIGDGFTLEELATYQKVVGRMVENYRTPPFDAYASRMNFHRIDLVSKDTGIAIDDPDHDTPLGGTRVAFPGGRLLRCNVKTAAEYVTAAVPDADYVQVVLNTHGKFLGSANSGQIVLLSTAGGHQRSIVVHEFAHNFAGLVDEYVDPKQSGNRPPPPKLARGVNVSLSPNVPLAKWHLWNIPEEIFFGRDRKKTVKPEDNVRCYEGAATFENGVYRPEENCHMQRGRGKAFCRVCSEALEVRLFAFLTPLRTVDPPHPSIALESRHSRRFEVVPGIQGGGETSVEIRWYLDGRRLEIKGRPAVGPVVDLAGSDMPEGSHHLTAVVGLFSPRVRVDRGRLSGSFTWSLSVVSDRGKLGLKKKLVCDAGVPLTLAVPDGWVLGAGPPEAALDAESRTFSWTPGERDHGAWSLVFAAGDAEGARAESVTVTVRSPLKKRNRGPKILFLPDQ